MIISDNSSESWPQVKTVGLSGLLVSFSGTLSEPANRAAIAFCGAILALDWEEVVEANSTLVSVFLRVDLAANPAAPLIARLRDVLAERDWRQAPLPEGRSLWRVPTLFGTDRAPQLQEAADLAGCSTQAAIADFCAAPVRALTIGFAPGQPYLGTLPERWAIPRQSAITPKVPAGALVTAVRQFCLFPYDTPTGWRHVGQTGFRSFRPWAQEPFVMRAGDEMQFEPVSAAEFAQIEARDTSGLGGALREDIS